jgi:hypothetical protein
MAYKKKKTSVVVVLLFLLTAFATMQTSAVASVTAPVAEAGGPYVGEEGQPVILDASNSSDPDGDSLMYRWYIDGMWIDNYYLPYMQWVWSDDFSGEILLEVSDGTNTSTDTALVTIANVPPEILFIDGPMAVDVGTEFLMMVNFNAPPGSRSASGFVDTYTARFDWGDGNLTELALGADEIWANASYLYTEEGVYHIVCTITDDDGGEASAFWDVMVGEIQLVDAGPDCTIDEGSLFVSHGSLADTDSLLFSVIVDYYDGTEAQVLSLNPGNTFDLSHRYLDDGVYSVYVMVFNDGMEYADGSIIVTVNNVAPFFESLSVSPSDGVQPGGSVQLTGMFSDPGVLDMHTVTVDWGDGSSSTYSAEVGVTEISGSHSYADAGEFTISVTVTDDDGESCHESLNLTVNAPSDPPGSIDPINETIQGLKIPKGFKNTLLSLVNNIFDMMKYHKTQAVMHHLQAFDRYVEAQSGKHLSKDQAQELTRMTQSMIRSFRGR